MMIRMNGDGSDYGSWETGSYVAEDDDFEDHSENESDGSDASDEHEHDSDDSHDEEDELDVHSHDDEDDDIEDDGGESDIELNPADFPNDEAYARALQDAEERELAMRLLALSGINES